MASIKLTGDTSGVITVSAPASAGTNTITLPATTGTMALTSDITTEIPSQTGNSGKYLTTNGSATSWAAAGSGTPTLLTTLNATSGTELTTGTLNLTTYKTVYVKLVNIGQGTDAGSVLQWKNNGGAYQTLFTQESDTTQSGHGYVICRPADLIPNYYYWASTYGARGRDWNVAIEAVPYYKYTTAMMIVPATTTMSFKWLGGQTFNLGQILIYGQT